ncbi:hypothetical protein T03_11632 [Trichinella britovi]|uniref:Uncharacterized protein n=1 Tax=Trichinella britovi TaxID=45882 RepID=A0A0V1CPT5_TRIBR|nr:hypothetical protein T03_11632 [Trichinella britovi]
MSRQQIGLTWSALLTGRLYRRSVFKFALFDEFIHSRLSIEFVTNFNLMRHFFSPATTLRAQIEFSNSEKSRNSCNLWGVLAHIAGESLPEIDGALQTCRTEQIIVHLLDVAKRQQHFSVFCLCAFQCLLLLLLLSSSSHLSSKNSSFTTGLAISTSSAVALHNKLAQHPSSPLPTAKQHLFGLIGAR